MRDVHTLIVLLGSSPTAVEDTVSAWRWACAEPCEIVIVGAEPRQGWPPGTHAVPPRPPALQLPSGWWQIEGLRWVIESGWAYRQLLLVTPSLLPLKEETDRWLHQVITQHTVAGGQPGLVGVINPTDPTLLFRQASRPFTEWGIPHERWENPPPYLATPFTLVTPMFAAAIETQLGVDRGLPMAAASAGGWPAEGCHYLSWLCHMLGFHQIGWGSLRRQIPPIYIGAPRQVHVPPMLLRSEFRLYAPVENAGYPEEYIRQTYRRVRGEPGEPPSRVAPLVTGGTPT